MSDPNEKSRVQVSVRVRPLLKTEESNCDPVVVSGQPDGRSVVVEEEGKRKRAFAYDHAFTGDQASLFETIGRPMLAEAFKGFNVCLFAYGQTGSGKTHSLLGDVENEQQQGVAPRFARSLFEEAQRMVEESDDLTIKISLSMIEVYMEKIRDLLVPRQRGVEPESLDIHEDAERRVYVKDVSVHHVMNFERMMDLLRKGNANRQTAETKMNETSSRSHAIMQITISQEFQSVEKRDLECMVSLVDLAGSERQTKTDTSGQRFEESKKINYSLMMLGRAMNSFSDRKNNEAFISLRESKLTRLLSESFGGNSKTWMLATVSPTAYNLGESISTLEYATNAMAITNKAIVNDVMKRIEVKEVKTAIASLEVRLRDLTLEKESQESKLAELQVERNALKASVTEPGNSAESDLDVSERLQKMLQYLRLSNIALKRRVEAASRQLIWSIDNNGSLGCYKGRCGVSLRSVLLGKRSSFVIQLATESGIASEARLKIQLFLVEALAAERTDVMQMVGRDLHFCLHVVGAEQLPEAYSAHSFCKFGMRYDNVEDRYFTTSTCEKTTNPTWGMAKQFKVLNLSEDAVRYLSEQSVFTFEVFGFAN